MATRQPVTVVRRGNSEQRVTAALDRMRRCKVMVGIPAEKAMRGGDVMNNASLMYIHEHGSDLRNIPARPVLGPAIASVQPMIQKEFEAAAKAMIDYETGLARNVEDVTRHLDRAGMVAANAAKRLIGQSPPLAPNAPSTIARKGSNAPLIDTGQLRRAITWVVETPPDMARCDPEARRDRERSERPETRQQQNEEMQQGNETAEATAEAAEVADTAAGEAAEAAELIVLL